MPMNSSSLHCMWSDRKTRLSLTRACEFCLFSQGWNYLVPVWTLFGTVPVPCGLVDPSWTRIGSFVNHCWIVAHLWVFVPIGELLGGSLLDRIGFLGHFVIGLSTGIVCLIADL